MPLPLSVSLKFRVNEIFYSLQGEGAHAGRAAVFLRLAGCNEACVWCDTKYADKINFLLTPAQILARVKKYPASLIVITGGEPCLQPLQPLLRLLKKNKFEVHLETNGSVDIDTSLIDCVTVSPKKSVNKNMLKKADVVKLVVDAKTDISAYKKYKNLYLQPEGNKKENIAKCLRMIKQNPQIKLSLQLHKIIDIK